MTVPGKKKPPPKLRIAPKKLRDLTTAQLEEVRGGQAPGGDGEVPGPVPETARCGGFEY